MTNAAAAATETVPSTPAGGAPASAPAGAPSTGGGGSSDQGTASQGVQPTGAPTASPSGGGSEQGTEVPGKAPEEPHVPWRRFREVQTEFTRTKAQHQTEVQRLNQQMAAMQREHEDLSRVKDDFSTLEQLLEDNPDLAEQLFQRAGRGGGQAAPARSSDVSPEVVNEVRQLRALFENQQKAHQQAQSTADEQQEMAQTDQQLTAAIGKLLTDHELDEGWLPHARAYILDTARRIPNLEMEEVPYVFAEWARPMHGLLVKQLDKWRTGKYADARTMPPAPNGNGGVMAAHREAAGANDRKTAQFLEEQLKNRLGWRNE